MTVITLETKYTVVSIATVISVLILVTVCRTVGEKVIVVYTDTAVTIVTIVILVTVECGDSSDIRGFDNGNSSGSSDNGDC